MIKDNINNILNNIGNAKLIAVSKTKPIEMIMEAYDAGIRDFGENKVQELISKIDKLPNDINWHMIGHLQTNKVKDIIGKVSLIHSVDSIKLAYVIDKEAKKKNIIVDVLLEINIANEESKYGFMVNELDNAINNINNLSNIKVLGFMCVAPNTDNPLSNRKYFRKMKELAKKYNYNVLSMGMSNDYSIAIEEGSSYIRVGTKIFGERIYNKSSN